MCTSSSPRSTSMRKSRKITVHNMVRWWWISIGDQLCPSMSSSPSMCAKSKPSPLDRDVVVWQRSGQCLYLQRYGRSSKQDRPKLMLAISKSFLAKRLCTPSSLQKALRNNTSSCRRIFCNQCCTAWVLFNHGEFRWLSIVIALMRTRFKCFKTLLKS